MRLGVALVLRSNSTPDQIFICSHFSKLRFIPSDRSSKDFICPFGKCFDFLSFFAFIMSSSAPDSVLDDILAAAELLSVSEGSPPSSPGVARTGGSRATPRRGGGVVSEGTVPSELFSVIAIDCSDMTFCFGAMCNRSSFCIKRNCTTKIHATSKMLFAGTSDSYVFIRRNIPGSVFVEPKLLSTKIPDDVMNDWESKTLSSTDWSTEFQAIDGTSEPLTSAEEIQTEAEFLVESSLLRTPAKRKKESFAGEEYEGVPFPPWKNRKYERTLPENPEDLEAMIDEGIRRGVISTTVSKIESYIEEMGDVLVEVNSVNHDRLITLEGTLEVMIGMVQTMKSRIGSSVDIGQKFSAPTLWGSTAFIADDLTKVSEDLSALQSEVVAPMKEAMTLLGSSDEDLVKKNDKMIKTVKLLLARVQALNTDMDEVKTDLLMVRTEQGVRFATPGATQGDATDDLMDFIMSEEKSVAGSVRSNPSVGIVSQSKSSSDEEDAEDSVMSIVNKLIKDVKMLQSNKQTNYVRFGGLGFTDLSECSAWIAKNFDGYQYGLIMDPLLMLDRIYGEDDVTDSDAFLKAMEVRYKMKIESGNEAAALNALKFARPRVFHKGRPTVVSVQNKSRLNLLPSHLDWNPGGEGIMDFCVTKLNALEAAIECEIGETFAVESTAHWISMKCLSASVTFLNQLFGAVEAIYKRLFNFSKFTTDQAWSLTTQVLDRILADLFHPRENIVQSLKTRNTPTTCAQIMFSAFKTHDIMAGYISHKFENHPSVSTEYVKFLATNSGSEKVVKLTETVETLKGKAAAALDEAKAATKKSDIAASKYADLVKEMAVLSRRVKSMEDKR